MSDVLDLSNETLGERIARARRARNLRQQDVADAISIPRTAMSRIESGKRKVSSTELSGIAKALEVPVEGLIAHLPTPTVSLDGLRRQKREIVEIASKHGASDVRVFGSVARGEADAASDVDLLVEMEQGRSLFDVASLMVELEDLVGTEVDIVTVDGLRERIRARVIAEAVTL